MKLSICALAVASTFALGTAANLAQAQQSSRQQDQTAQQQAKRDPIDIRRWDMSALRGGHSAERLLDTEVRGENGRKLGEVENFLVNREGRITGIIVESQGILEVGDTHFFVPWNQVRLGPDLKFVQVPVAENTLKNFSLFNNDESIYRGPGIFRGKQLLSDWVRLRGGASYGYVNDIVFSTNGQIQAIVVSPDMRYGYGRYAYPYYAYNPGLGYFGLPYERSEIEKLRPFDYSALGIARDGVARGATR